MANQVPLVIADFETNLSGAIAVGATSFTLASATDDDGNTLAAGKYCFTLNNGRSNKQYLIGQVNGTAVTSVVSVDRRGNETSGATEAARSGSPIIISDFATIQRVADILRGQENLDGDNPIVYDAEPTLSDRKEVATVAYVLDNVAGGTVNFDNQIISASDATAGETVAAGDWVFFQTSDQEWYLIDADTAAEVDASYIGVALGAGSDGASITGGIQTSGVYTTTGLTAGDIYYLSNTAGEITNSTGTTERAIGVALSTTKLLMNFNEKRLPTADEKAAMAAGGDFGTASTSNKFITEDYLNGGYLSDQVTFTSSGTWTKDANLVRVFVQAWGGGGGGWNSADDGGGGGGGYSEGWFEAADLGATETITVGAGGTTNGGDGGDTTFGSLLTAAGGIGPSNSSIGGSGGGIGNVNVSPLSGAGSTGATSGSDGLGGGGGGHGNGSNGGNGYYGGGGGASDGGTGGSSTFGGAGGSGAGDPGTQPGGGGGRAAVGGAGQVIVTEYYS